MSRDLKAGGSSFVCGQCCFRKLKLNKIYCVVFHENGLYYNCLVQCFHVMNILYCYIFVCSSWANRPFANKNYLILIVSNFRENPLIYKGCMQIHISSTCDKYLLCHRLTHLRFVLNLKFIKIHYVSNILCMFVNIRESMFVNMYQRRSVAHCYMHI